MDRKDLLSLLGLHLTRRPAAEPARKAADPRRADQVYLAAQAIRSRIDAALAASRRE
jgi:hypothetical protein